MDVRQDIRLYPPPDAVSGIQKGPKKTKTLTLSYQRKGCTQLSWPLFPDHLSLNLRKDTAFFPKQVF